MEGRPQVLTTQCLPSQVPQRSAVREHPRHLSSAMPAGLPRSHHRRHGLCGNPGRREGLLSGEAQGESWRKLGGWGGGALRGSGSGPGVQCKRTSGASKALSDWNSRAASQL